MKLKKGDTVKFLIGKDRGKTGKVLRVDTKEGMVLVEGLHMFKKHVRPKRQGDKGEVVSLARPVNASNVMLVCPSCHAATRIGRKISDGGKSRICKKCKATI